MVKLKLLDLFSGIGGLSLGFEESGFFETVAFCEIEDFPRKILCKHWPEIPLYDDVRQLTAARLAADGIAVDAICGGFPCQDLSVAGRRAGIHGERSGLYREYIRLVGELRPRFVAMENVTGLLNSGLDVVLGALAEIGYDAVWHCLRASRLGLPHRRDRIFILAYPRGAGWERFVAHIRLPFGQEETFPKHRNAAVDAWMQMVAGVCGLRNGDGISLQVERSRLKTLGNAVAPPVARAIGAAVGLALEHEAKGIT